ncbi:hypothetical protein [Caballeronia sp. LZ035]|uniref:hypothetical protein n=1 Tax=Caballeronia sp. LZ035 TaxID=3038568 RepID=UPI0028544F8C|nr:hypothetical protein [Caballeronia sp. LZ035]MDR5756480.1 hypothetical protein [Caballeronia sp. LZ035]
MHLERHRKMLMEASKEAVPAVVAQIKREKPEALHVLSGKYETLSQRNFHDQPVSEIPMASFVRAFVPPPPPTKTDAAPSSEEGNVQAEDGAPSEPVSID